MTTASCQTPHLSCPVPQSYVIPLRVTLGLGPGQRSSLADTTLDAEGKGAAVSPESTREDATLCCAALRYTVGALSSGADGGGKPREEGATLVVLHGLSGRESLFVVFAVSASSV